MNTFSIILSVGPLALYCILLGVLHLRRKPTVVSGGRDLGCLGLAMIGLFLAGPAQLFFPQAAFNLFGISVWIALILLYLFILVFAIVNTKPSLIVFGLDVDSLSQHVDQVLQELDPGTKWLNHTFVSPSLGIQGVIEPAGVGLVSHAIATKREQNLMGWLLLRRGLSAKLPTLDIERSSSGYRWLALGFSLLGLVGYALINQSTAIAQGIREMLRN